MEFIRDTTSLSPLTNKEIPAKIYRDGNNVIMLKTDESGNEHKDILETDYELYMLESSIVPESQLPFEHIHLYSTSLCNQNCTCCYEVFDAEKEEQIGRASCRERV